MEWLTQDPRVWTQECSREGRQGASCPGPALTFPEGQLCACAGGGSVQAGGVRRGRKYGPPRRRLPCGRDLGMRPCPPPLAAVGPQLRCPSLLPSQGSGLTLCGLHGAEAKGALWGLFTRARVPSVGPTLVTSHLPKAPPLHTITWGLGFPPTDLARSHVQSVAARSRGFSRSPIAYVGNY